MEAVVGFVEVSGTLEAVEVVVGGWFCPESAGEAVDGVDLESAGEAVGGVSSGSAREAVGGVGSESVGEVVGLADVSASSV